MCYVRGIKRIDSKVRHIFATILFIDCQIVGRI